MDPFLVEKGYAFHPACDQDEDSLREAKELKVQVQQLIRYAQANSPRSLQRAIGPSEIGDDCERRIAYRLADVTESNRARDMWPATVGTAIHQWLEKAVDLYQTQHENMGWVTEIRIAADALVSGSSDVYDSKRFRVTDWKTANTDNMRKYRVQGPPRQYIIQANIYGLGHENAGRQVRDVALVFLPRSGWLSGIYVWRDVYRREVAEQALARMYAIGDRLLAGVRVGDIPASPSDNCGYCPWFQSGDTFMGVPADERGCPGR
jgi:hypothetical protein